MNGFRAKRGRDALNACGGGEWSRRCGFIARKEGGGGGEGRGRAFESQNRGDSLTCRS